MDFYETVYRRRSVRKYKPDPVPREVVMRILGAANWAPSGINLQQWEFLVVGGEKLKALGESYARVVEKIPGDPERKEQMLQFARNYGGAPLAVVALAPAAEDPFQRKMHLESVCAAFENLLLAACAEGLGTCWMLAPLLEESAVRQILNIPGEKEIVAITPLGYPEVVPPAPPRQDPDLKQKVTWLE